MKFAYYHGRQACCFYEDPSWYDLWKTYPSFNLKKMKNDFYNREMSSFIFYSSRKGQMNKLHPVFTLFGFINISSQFMIINISIFPSTEHFILTFRRLINLQEQHVDLYTEFVQNTLYFEKYMDDLKEYFKFSGEYIRRGERIINSHNM